MNCFVLGSFFHLRLHPQSLQALYLHISKRVSMYLCSLLCNGSSNLLTIDNQMNTYSVASSSMNLAAAAMPLDMAPSTFGIIQKSPQIANRLFSNHKHFSSPAMLTAGKALPLKTFTPSKEKNFRNSQEQQEFCQCQILCRHFTTHEQQTKAYKKKNNGHK